MTLGLFLVSFVSVSSSIKMETVSSTYLTGLFWRVYEIVYVNVLAMPNIYA